MKKILISAVSLNNVIGSNNKMPWNNDEELKYFKELTLNNSVLMGRKTYESIGKILPNRINLIISKSLNKKEITENGIVFPSIYDAIKYAEKLEVEKLFIIGGSEIYLQMINNVDELLISRIPFEIVGDKYFPSIDSNIWELEEKKKHKTFTLEKYSKLIS